MTVYSNHLSMYSVIPHSFMFYVSDIIPYVMGMKVGQNNDFAPM